MLTVCLQCGRLDLLAQNGHLQCPKCGFELTLKRYDKLIADGSRIFRHGFQYRTLDEAQIAKYGRIVRKYKLGDPTVVEAAIAIIVSGVLGNTAYAVVKSALKSIYTQLAKRRLKRRAGPSDRGLCAEDADLVFRLIGSDDNFAKTFFGYTREYVGNQKSPESVVARASGERSALDRYTGICKNDPPTYVFASPTGKCFHRKNCISLSPPIRRLRIKTAILMPLSPCRRCKPL